MSETEELKLLRMQLLFVQQQRNLAQDQLAAMFAELNVLKQRQQAEQEARKDGQQV